MALIICLWIMKPLQAHYTEMVLQQLVPQQAPLVKIKGGPGVMYYRLITALSKNIT